jgi:hypothetical protein
MRDSSFLVLLTSNPNLGPRSTLWQHGGKAEVINVVSFTHPPISFEVKAYIDYALKIVQQPRTFRCQDQADLQWQDSGVFRSQGYSMQGFGLLHECVHRQLQG